MSEWADLRALRETGRKPTLPVVITTRYSKCMAQANAGAMVIVQEKGKPIPVELLEGLDVELYLDDCAQATAVANIVRQHNITPKSFFVWCECEQWLDWSWNHDCKQGEEVAAAWERLCQFTRAH